MVAKFAKEEGVEEVAIGNVVIMLLLYASDVVLFGNISRGTKAYEGIGIFSHGY